MCNVLLVGKFTNCKYAIIYNIERVNNNVIFSESDQVSDIIKGITNNRVSIIILDGNSENIYGITSELKRIPVYSEYPMMVVVNPTNHTLKNHLLNVGVESVIDENFDKPHFISQFNLLIRLKIAESKIISKENGISLNEMKFKDLFSAMTNAFCFYQVVYDEHKKPVDYIFLEVNPSFEEILGMKSYEIVGKSLKAMVHENDTQWLTNFNSVVESGKPIQFVGYQSHLNRWFDVRAYLTKNKYLVLILSDITNEKEMNNTVTKISKELDQILNITSPFRVIDINHNVLMVNDSYCDLFQITRESVIGKPCNSKFGSNRCNNQCQMKNQKLAIDKKPFEMTSRLKGGQYIKCLVSTRPFENDKNEVVGVVESFTDITRLKDIENRLIKAKKKAEESDKLKSAFLANMSHEIRTPMNSIIGYSDLLIEEDIDDETKNSYLKIIQKAGNDLLKLVDDIIDIAKIEAGQLNIKLESVSVNSILAETHSMLSEHTSLKLNGVSLNLIQKEEFNDFILTDGLRLKQILVNIINNAIKFTQSGSINFGYTKKDNSLEFFVKDTGIGLTKEQIGIIFERFRQADDSTTKKYGGNGLGLSISKGLVDLLGGKIWVESEWKKGTTFYFTIPYIEGIFISENVVKKTKYDYSWRGYTILVAEDVDINYNLICEILKQTGVKTIRAKDGLECIEIFKENADSIDLVLMDIQMPLVNGYEATAEIKSISKITPIIIQSAYAMSDDIKKCYEAGCDDYIAKPMTKDTLLERINALMYKK